MAEGGGGATRDETAIDPLVHCHPALRVPAGDEPHIRGKFWDSKLPTSVRTFRRIGAAKDR